MNKATKLLCSNFYISVKTDNLLEFWKPCVAACADRINWTQNLKSRLYFSHRSGRIAPFVTFYFLRVEVWSSFTQHSGTELWKAERRGQIRRPEWEITHLWWRQSFFFFFFYVTQLPSQIINGLYVKDGHKQWSAHLGSVELTDFTVSAFRKQTWCKTMDFCTDFRTSAPPRPWRDQNLPVFFQSDLNLKHIRTGFTELRSAEQDAHFPIWTRGAASCWTLERMQQLYVHLLCTVSRNKLRLFEFNAAPKSRTTDHW